MGQELPADAGGCLIDAALDAALARVATLTPILVASDYDGTLAPIVDDPAQAGPDAGALDAFLRAAECSGAHGAIVSGRAVEVLERFVGAHSSVTLIGSHGATLTSDSEGLAVDQLIRSLSELGSHHPGTVIEPKPTGASFHYRGAVDQESASEAARRVAITSGAKVIEGKYIVEAIIGTGNKGTAIEALRESTGAAAVVFVGDDVTDEHAFATLGTGDIGIKVGDGVTAAKFRVPDVAAVADVFNRLANYVDQHGT
jgi:trehalose 6-phosphate phosphatase